MTKTVAVDFDGVIHLYSKGWRDGSIYDEPVPGALNAIRALMAAGIAVFVHTTRDPQQVASWLVMRGVKAGFFRPFADHPEFWNSTEYVLVTNRKLPAVAFVDDRGIRFESWEQALADLAAFEGIEIR